MSAFSLDLYTARSNSAYPSLLPCAKIRLRYETMNASTHTLAASRPIPHRKDYYTVLEPTPLAKRIENVFFIKRVHVSG